MQQPSSSGQNNQLVSKTPRRNIPALLTYASATPTEETNPIISPRFLSGTPEMLLNWFSVITSPCLFEVIGQLKEIERCEELQQSVLLLRGQLGMILRVTFYINDYHTLSPDCNGFWIRCVGRMQDANTMRAFTIREATPNEVYALPRMSSLSEQEVNLMKFSTA
ncbi:uncharacterized protein [Atheta coriaria]|uniref:uncharacterized protein n=1 Tax=Dalotia coriaria TaxID=877792 RepID=UPI0031F34153